MAEVIILRQPTGGQDQEVSLAQVACLLPASRETGHAYAEGALRSRRDLARQYFEQLRATDNIAKRYRIGASHPDLRAEAR
jgi:hypothetical protein